MQLQQQLSQQQQELLQQLQLLHHQYLMHHGINLQQQFLSHKQKSHQLNGGKYEFEFFRSSWGEFAPKKIFNKKNCIKIS